MATCFLAPGPIQDTFFIPGGNVPGNGVQVFFYANKSATKQTAYHDPLGATPWTNPIVLDSGGNLPLGGEVWFPQGQTFTVKYAPANDSDPPVSPYRTLDDLTGINDTTLIQSEWVAAPTPSFVSASSFTFAGDQTAVGLADIGRAMKFTVTAGTVYGFIEKATFGAGVTTVLMNMVSGVLDAGLSAAFYGLLTATHLSVPPGAGDVGTSTRTAATTTDIWHTGGNYMHITGTSFIGNFGIAQRIGQTMKLVFDSATGLTTSASFFIPGLLNVTTGVGDTAMVVADSLTVARIFDYTFAISRVPTVTVFSTAATTGTYITPLGCTALEAEAIGGGGGGAGCASGGATNGTSTTFGTLTGNGGAGGGAGGASGGAGGSASGGDINLSGGGGQGAGLSGATGSVPGGTGGCSFYGGAGGGGVGAGTGKDGVANTGGGGGGGGSGGAGTFSGAAGGAGGYARKLFRFPASSFAYAVGPGGSLATATTSGGNGGSGLIVVREYYVR